MSDELWRRGALELAGMIARKEVSSRDVVQAHLDRIDEVVPPGTDIGTLDQAYVPPAIQFPNLRRRHVELRAAA